MKTRLVFSMVIATCITFAACMGFGQELSRPDAATRNNIMDTDSRPAAVAARTATTNDFVIGPDDILFVQVWKEPELTRTITVRPDGKISLALIGEITASGQTPKQLESKITAKLSSFMADATVSIIVQEVRSRQFSVLGKVAHPGTYPLTRSVTVLDAIALAGGFRDFAKQNSVYILRQIPNGLPQRLAFNYKEVVKGNKLSQNVDLQPKDTVVVP